MLRTVKVLGSEQGLLKDITVVVAIANCARSVKDGKVLVLEFG